MPMTPAGLKAKIIADMTAIIGPPDDPTKQESFAEALGKAIVEYIQTNATVASTVLVASVSGVTVGGGVSGPGAGTATGTIT